MAGRAMLPPNMLNAATGAMRSLHDCVLSLEKRRLRENDVAYPVFVAKVPEGKGFVDSAIGGRSSCGLMTSLLCLPSSAALHLRSAVFAEYGDADH